MQRRANRQAETARRPRFPPPSPRPKRACGLSASIAFARGGDINKKAARDARQNAKKRSPKRTFNKKRVSLTYKGINFEDMHPA